MTAVSRRLFIGCRIRDLPVAQTSSSVAQRVVRIMPSSCPQAPDHRAFEGADLL